MTRALRELGEDKLLAQVFPRLNRNSRVVIGAGDDCAMVKFRGAKDWLLLKTDCVVEEIHFTKETNARAVGWKAMMRALSDFAAMSGIPEFALITLAATDKKKHRGCANSIAVSIAPRRVLMSPSLAAKPARRLARQ